jgi:hypothetical protein
MESTVGFQTLPSVITENVVRDCFVSCIFGFRQEEGEYELPLHIKSL